MTYRNPGLRWLLPLIGAALAFVSWGEGSWTAAAWTMGVWAVLAGSTARLRVEADDVGLRVVNYVRTTSVPWSDIAGIDSDDRAGDGPLCRVRLRAGGQIQAWALYGGRNHLGADYITRSVHELEQRRSTHPPRSHPARRLPVKPLGGRARPEPGRTARPRDLRDAGLWVGALIAGLGALVGGAFLLNTALSFSQHGVATTAIVTQVDGGRDAEVTVKYTVDGAELTNTADDWIGEPDVGDQVDVVFDSRDPNLVTDAAGAGTTGSFLVALWVLAIGVASLVVAVVGWFRIRIPWPWRRG